MCIYIYIHTYGDVDLYGSVLGPKVANSTKYMYIYIYTYRICICLVVGYGILIAVAVELGDAGCFESPKAPGNIDVGILGIS